MGVRKIENTDMRLNSVPIIPSCFDGDRVPLDSAGCLGARVFLPQPPYLPQELSSIGRWHLVMVPVDGEQRCGRELAQ